MLSIFTRIRNNSTWLLDDEVIVVYNTSWILNEATIIYPMVYYYVLNDKSHLYFMTRAEFLMNAKKYNIKEHEDYCSTV